MNRTFQINIHWILNTREKKKLFFFAAWKLSSIVKRPN